MTRRSAGLDKIAGARSGTSRCGITLVNQDPGPKTSQSALATAPTAAAHAGGSTGVNRTAST